MSLVAKNRCRNGEKHSPAQQDPSPYLPIPVSPSSHLPVPRGQLISAHDEIMGDDFPTFPSVLKGRLIEQHPISGKWQHV